MYLFIKNFEDNDNGGYFFFDNAFDLLNIIKGFKYIESELEAILYIFDKEILSIDLLKIKNKLLTFNIKIRCIYSNLRQNIIAAKSLRIDGILSKNETNKENFIKQVNDKNNDLTYTGVVRSGDKISSKGNLFIIGDVNPGAQISAKNNIYVWGKLSGVAIAGTEGEDKATISSLYLNALQLRINKIVAIGPKEKPNSYYPEIALIESGKIVIKPFLINN